MCSSRARRSPTALPSNLDDRGPAGARARAGQAFCARWLASGAASPEPEARLTSVKLLAALVDGRDVEEVVKKLAVGHRRLRYLSR